MFNLNSRGVKRCLDPTSPSVLTVGTDDLRTATARNRWASWSLRFGTPGTNALVRREPLRETFESFEPRKMVKPNSGWCFGTFFVFFHIIIGNRHSRWRTHIFQRGTPPTRISLKPLPTFLFVEFEASLKICGWVQLLNTRRTNPSWASPWLATCGSTDEDPSVDGLTKGKIYRKP